MGGDSEKLTVIIANGGTTSAALRLPATFFPAGIIMPVMTASTAITFEVSTDNVTYYPLQDGLGSNYSVTITPATAAAITLDPTRFYAWEYIKVKVADAQAAERTIAIIVRNY